MTSDHRLEVPSLLETDAFVWETVWPCLGIGSEPPAVELVRYRAGVIEYRFGSHRAVFAKPFDEAADGAAAYAIQRALWDGGFDRDAHYRVPEPIAYLPDERVILMRAAPGRRLRELATSDREAWHEGLRGAARWLAVLHSWPQRLGPSEDSTRLALHMARRVARTAATRPDVERTLVRLLDELAARSPTLKPPAEVQTHGRYGPLHVYVASDCITVIDPDRAAPGDPAKDVGEFLHRLRDNLMTARVDGEATDRATAVFLEEYARRSAGDLTRLAFYWSYSVLFTIVVRTRKASADDAEELERRTFYESEFAAIPDRVAAFALPP